MWLYALAVLGRHVPDYAQKGIDLVRQIHDAFVVPGRGVIWKMKEDFSAPYPGYGFGALDAFDGYCIVPAARRKGAVARKSPTCVC